MRQNPDAEPATLPACTSNGGSELSLTATQAPVESRPKPRAQRLHLPRLLQPLTSQLAAAQL